MTRVFTEEGVSVPVTVIEVEPNRVTQLRTIEIDGYSAVQVTTGSRKASRVSKPEAGHLAKAGVEAGRGMWEFRLSTGEVDGFEVGGEIKVDMFEAGQIVDVRGTRARSSVMVSGCRMPRMATHCPTGRQARSDSVRRRAAYSKVKRWQAIWAT
jgi:hypothetical protein